MLRLARAKLAEAGLARVELRQGDMYALPLAAGSADTVILHQVLHYAQHPAAAVAEAARLLGPGGRLLIVDFAPHEREELRDQRRPCPPRLRRRGDAEAVSRSAGLDGRVVEHLDGGELTVTIWLGASRRAASAAEGRRMSRSASTALAAGAPLFADVARRHRVSASNSSRPRPRRWRRRSGSR